ncbi:MAG: hypothetical protein MHPSP_004933, partial [Paramarteilia canceri]
ISELDRIFNGINVTRHDSESKKPMNQIWKLDQNLNVIHCSKPSSYKIGYCSPTIRKNSSH